MPRLRRQLPSANALFVFETAARCGNFTRAASELGVTQPAVSRMLSQLEEFLEAKLFLRTPAGTTLTENGEILFRSVSEGFSGIEAAIQEIRARCTGLETVTLSVSTAFTTHWLMPRLHELQKQFPSIDLRFQLISGSVSGSVDDVDLGMRFVTGEDVDHQAVLIMPELLLPVASPGYREQLLNDTENFLPTLISLSDSRTDWFDRFPTLSKDAQVNSHSLVFSDYSVVLQAALLGQGIAVGWINVVSHWLRTGSLVPVEDAVVLTERRCHFIHARKRPLSHAASQVQEWILEKMREDLKSLNSHYPELGLCRFVAC